MFPLLSEVAYCPAQDARSDLQVVAVGAEAASHTAAGRPGQQAGALTRRVQARVVIGSSKGEMRNCSWCGVLTDATTVALTCEDCLRGNP